MQRRSFRILFLLVFLCSLSFVRCTRKAPEYIPGLTINLYSGITDVAYLGELERNLLGRNWSPKRIELEGTSKLRELGIAEAVHFRGLGVRAYSHRGIVKLIEIAQPFPGSIIGDKHAFFSLKKPEREEWRDVLIKRFGQPVEEALGGGLFRSRILVYNWGDVVFNRIGPSQISIYRDPEIAKFRKENFGSQAQIFSRE